MPVDHHIGFPKEYLIVEENCGLGASTGEDLAVAPILLTLDSPEACNADARAAEKDGYSFVGESANVEGECDS